VAGLLTAAVAAREEGLLDAALKAHFLQKRLGWPGLWFLLPRWVTPAKLALRTVKAENEMRAAVLATPAPEDPVVALAEHAAMVAAMDAAIAEDAAAFSVADFLELRKGARVVAGMASALDKVAGSPICASAEAAVEEHARVEACVAAAVRFEPAALASAPHMALRKGARVVAATTVNLSKRGGGGGGRRKHTTSRSLL